MLEIEGLSKHFGDTYAVSNVSMAVPEGSFLVLLGPSGCGKTTLLRMLAGLEVPSAGRILFDDRVVSDGARAWRVEPADRNSGMVFQSYALWPHMSVYSNVAWPLKVAGMPRDERDTRVADVLKLLGIDQLAERYPNEISGGQQQRVAIARTIAPRPKVLLFDEPLSNLDARLRVDMRTELMRLHRAIGATTVYVTHDQIEAMTMATHVAVLNNGHIEQLGTPDELVDHPDSAFVATFVGTPPNNLLAVEQDQGQAHVGGVAMDLQPPSTAPCQAMIRPQALSLGEAGDANTLTLELVEKSALAGRTLLTAMNCGIRLTAVLDHRLDAHIGDAVSLTLPAQPSAWFSTEGARLH